MGFRRWHKITGLFMLLPLLGWCATGLVFLTKPGYEAAYEQLAVKTYALPPGLSVRTEPGWLDVRLMQTVLGTHLLVKDSNGWHQRDIATGEVRDHVSDSDAEKLLSDATAHNPQRYGGVVKVSDDIYRTSTGVDITLNWSQLLLRQQGRDSRLINKLYEIHYLRWTGNSAIDRIVGPIGLALLFLLALAGAVMSVRRR